MENLENKIKDCKSYSEVGRLLGYNYYNARVKQCVIEYCLEHEINIEKQISDWKERKVYCLNCGKEIIGEGRFKKKFCSSSCSASYTNKLRPPKSKEERIKIKNSLINYYKRYKKITKNIGTDLQLISDCILDGSVLNPYKVNYEDKLISKNKLYNKTCVICGKLFKPFLNKSGNLYRGETCSKECSKKLKSIKSKEVQEKLISEGKHKGWQSRNILSYAESFWGDVLNKNSISFISNKPVKQENCISNYFLDFYIKKNNRIIDLEIDGKQHEYKDRMESDLKRDEYLNTLGYVIYRIKWNEISSEKGKQNMKKKINDFIEFYKSI